MTQVSTTIFLTADVALTVGGQRVFLITRLKEPDMNHLCFPGGHVDFEDEGVPHAAARELFEETNVRVDPAQLELLCLLDGKDRDIRPGRRITAVYTIDVDEAVLADAHAGDDAATCGLYDITDLQEDGMGFDHYLGIQHLRQKLRI